MLVGKERDVDVWRVTPASGNWGDPTWSYSHTFQATVQVFEASDGLRNNQRFANVRHLLCAPVDTDISSYDEVVIDSVHERVVYVEKFDSEIISHLEIFTAEAQYERS